MTKMVKKKTADERIVQEIGKVYRIAYYLFNIGLLADLFLKTSAGSIPSGLEAFWYIGFEAIMVVGVNIVALALLWRRGLMDDEAAYAACDIFPWQHYLKEALIVGGCAGLFLCIIKVLFAQMPPLACLILFVSVLASTVILVMPCTYLLFRLAKRRREKMYPDEDGE